MSSASLSIIQLNGPSSSSSTCIITVDNTCNIASPALHQCVGVNAEAETPGLLRCDQMLGVSRTDSPTSNDPDEDEHPNNAVHTSNITIDPLFDDNKLIPFVPQPPCLEERTPRPWQLQRSVSLPPRLTTIPIAFNHNSTPLSLFQGPSGHYYVPLSSRPANYESLRDDYGIRFKKRHSAAAMFLHWHLLTDEDAAPNRLRERVVASALRKGERVKGWFKRKLGLLHGG